MIANPSLPAFRYNPYDKTLTHEVYEYERMTTIRKYGSVSLVHRLPGLPLASRPRFGVPQTTASGGAAGLGA